MFKSFFVLISILLAVGCKKEEPSIDIVDLKGKYLICDSLQTTKNGETNTVILGKGKGLDLFFALLLTVYSTPVRTYKYTYINSKVYYWDRNVSLHEGDYWQIVFKKGNQLHLYHKNLQDKSSQLFFYTVE